MSDDTPRLKLPQLAEMQEMNAATINEAFAQIDAVSGLSLRGRFVDTPPASPADGDAYLTGGAPTGAWTGQAYKIAWCIDGGWRFQIPFDGLTAFVESEATHIVYRGGTWTQLGALIGGVETSIASATTCDLGAAGALCVLITGTSAITGFGPASNTLRLVRFAQGLTLAHDPVSLALLGGASRIVAAGDCGIYVSDASGNWRERAFFRAAADPGDAATKSGAETLTNKTFGPAMASGAGASTGVVTFGHGAARSGDGDAVLDLHAQAGSDYDARIVRTAGANGVLDLIQNGSGRMRFLTNGAVGTGAGAAIALSLDNGQVARFGGDVLPAVDNARNLGAAASRFANIYAATGAINTSDAGTKQDVRALSAAEMAVARRLASDVRLFRFRDAVAAKGDAARLHAGLLAQDVEAAFAAEGLDARRYGLFCADADENGQTILGLRPDELAQFVIAGLAARLTALEAA
ncbi:MAG TPA: DUF2793 domain-containing protein [Rhizomicrobium sp.]|jgi:hypothetical protein|nr:DUF2793 domain-containing protein [Rhizomicrobium sp.]